MQVPEASITEGVAVLPSEKKGVQNQTGPLKCQQRALKDM